MPTPTTTIVLGPETVTVTVENEQGMKSVKNTNMENVQQIFMREQSIETPLLPSQWGVVKYYRKNNFEGYVLTTPPTERKVSFDTGARGIPEEATIPVPPLLWVFEVRTSDDGSKSLTHSMMYALKHELLSFKDKVFHAPYPNIGVSHGICWGDENPLVPTGKSIQNIPARFFGQPFNSDLSSNRVASFESDILEERTDNALYHMAQLARDLAQSKEAGEEYVYPFDSLKSSSMDVKDAISAYLPRILS
ncbi:prokaryotic E2 ligase family D protein [Bacillus subtilis]|uniref:prokaryotic E2 ligase family D protein n=1 Tax=Bacillus subtilis TaxID=1423 RepID=UPI0021DB3343|nr:prokaryotic E2 ligase family D protein [Bacillus subtilis]